MDFFGERDPYNVRQEIFWNWLLNISNPEEVRRTWKDD